MQSCPRQLPHQLDNCKDVRGELSERGGVFFFRETSINELLTQFEVSSPCLQPAALQVILFSSSWTCLTLERLIVFGCCLTHSLDFNCLVIVVATPTCSVSVVMFKSLFPWSNDEGEVPLVRASSSYRTLKQCEGRLEQALSLPLRPRTQRGARFLRAEFLWWCFRRSDALTRPARCRSDLQAGELLEEIAVHLAVAQETQSPDPHCTPNRESHNPRTAVCSETHGCPCSRSRHFAGATLSRLLHRSHGHAASLAAALHPNNICCATGHIPLCARLTCVPNQCKQGFFSSSPGALGPPWLRTDSLTVSPPDLKFPEAHGFLNHVSVMAYRSLLIPTSHLLLF